MKAPGYEWTCQKCRRTNLAHTEVCSNCGFCAYYKAKDLTDASEDFAVIAGDDQKELAKIIWMFFPEAVPAVVLAVYVPFWSIKLLGTGHYFPAICLLVGEIVFGYAFIQGMRRNKKWNSYISMLGFIGMAAFIHFVVK